MKGIRWKIGDGSSIKVWVDPWLRDPINFRVLTPMMHELSNILVNDLFTPGCIEWDVELVEELFNERDRVAILSIPLNPLGCVDKEI